MGFLKNDQDYLDAGVEPPEHNLTNLPGDDNASLAAIIGAQGKHLHLWKSIGGHLECDKGGHIHGMAYDHLNQILVGTSPEGVPVFKPIVLSTAIVNNDKHGASRPKKKHAG